MRYEYVLNLSDFNPRHAFVSADDLQLRAARPKETGLPYSLFETGQLVISRIQGPNEFLIEDVVIW
jgi:hypothetical protein